MKVNFDAILAAFKTKRNEFALSKPILIGNQNLQTLLENSKVTEQNYSAVADSFILSKGINPNFWENIKAKAPEIGAEAIADFATTVEIGNFTKNHLPAVKFFKGKIGTDAKFTSPSSYAKLSQAELVALINQNNPDGDLVPTNIPGATPQARVETYAAAMKSRLELIFPAVSLVAEIKRSNTDKLTKIGEVETFIDTNSQFDFKRQNLDKYLIDQKINLDAKTKSDLKTVLRIYKLTADPLTGATLVEAGLHSSMQLYFSGKTRLTDLLTQKGVAEKTVHTSL